MNALDLFFRRVIRVRLYNQTLTDVRSTGAGIRYLHCIFHRRKERSEFNQNVRFFDVIAAVESVRPKVDAFMQFDPATNGSTLMYNLQACAVTLAASSSTNFSRCVADNPTYWNER